MVGIRRSKEIQFPLIVVFIPSLFSIKCTVFQKDTTKSHAPNVKGFISWYQARVYAILGNKEASVNQLLHALDEGRGKASWQTFTHMDLANLRGYEPYERLVESRE